MKFPALLNSLHNICDSYCCNVAGRSDTRETPKGKMDIQPQSPTSGQGDVQLKGRNTFAVPRNVKPLGWSSRSTPPSDAANEQEADNPKSNDEFRKMLMKS